MQYAAYAVEQQENLQGASLEKALTYWKEQLGGELPTLELITDHPRPAIQTFRGGYHDFTIPPDVAEQLQQLSQ